MDSIDFNPSHDCEMEERVRSKKRNRFIFYVSFILVMFILIQVLTIVVKGTGLMHSGWEFAMKSSKNMNLYYLGKGLDSSIDQMSRLASCIPREVFDIDAKSLALTVPQVSCLKEVLSGSLDYNPATLQADQSPDTSHATSKHQELDIINLDQLQALRDLREELRVAGNRLSHSVQMMPLKDLSVEGMTRGNATWFMSSVHGAPVDGKSEEFRFPSDSPTDDSQRKLLCLQGNHTTKGTMNKYGFAWKDYLPPGATYLPGLTFIADNYWDYANPWHSMTALVNFAAWRAAHGCKVPDRIVTYHWGEVATKWGDWISNVVHASFGARLKPENMSSYAEAPVCFEDAVVVRRGIGSMSRPRMNALFDMVRCKVHKHCNITPRSVFLDNKGGKIDITLIARTGAREFSDLPAVISAVSEQCNRVNGCQLHVVRISNLSFCEQVEIMSKTDILVTSHGAQLTNMMFMPKGGSVMEMYPKGWLEFAGVGQYIYSWLADWTQLIHEGTWRDPEGPECPYDSTTERLKCFLIFKDRPLAVNATHLSAWTSQVLMNVQARRGNASQVLDANCACESVDNMISSLEV